MYGKKQLTLLNKPNERIQLEFIGSIIKKNQVFYISPSMDQFSKWPASSFCKKTDVRTAVRFLLQYLNLNGPPKTTRTDKTTTLTGRMILKNSPNKILSYIHTHSIGRTRIENAEIDPTEQNKREKKLAER